MTQFLTAVFSLRSPNAHKRRILELAYRSYDRTAQELLDWCEEHLPMIEEAGRLRKADQPVDKYNGDSVARCLPPISSIRAPLASVVRDALRMDVAAQIASFLMQRKINPNAGFPTAFTSVSARQEAMSEYAKVGADEEDERFWAAEVMRRSKLLHRPISYVRSSDFALLS